MRPAQFSADTLITLLGKQTIASLPEVMAALGARASRRTAFRKLKDLAARTSYSHRGGYYTSGTPARQLRDHPEIPAHHTNGGLPACLRVRAHRVKKVYKTGVKVADAQMRELHITEDSVLPKWNYTIEPIEPM